MASIAREKNGNRRILFVAPDGKRPTIRLGKVSQRAAEGIKYRVEQLLEALNFNRSMEADLERFQLTCSVASGSCYRGFRGSNTTC